MIRIQCPYLGICKSNQRHIGTGGNTEMMERPLVRSRTFIDQRHIGWIADEPPDDSMAGRADAIDEDIRIGTATLVAKDRLHASREEILGETRTATLREGR